MNEKIKEMSLRCEFDVGQIHAEILCRIESDWNTLPQEERDYVFSLLEERQEGFAKSIIKECGIIADEFRDEHLLTLPSQRMRETFGVE